MPDKIIIALAGNPNCGKTTVFNALTGARQHIANYPGVTVEKKSGQVTHQGCRIEVVDLPGIYSLTAYSLEEIVARDFLINQRPDLVINIVDASNLDRNMYLTVQFRELGVPMIIALNMIDVAAARDIAIDERKLSELLEVPVVPMVARSNRGLGELLDAVVQLAGRQPQWRPTILSYGLDIDESLREIEALIQDSEIYDRKYPARWRALKCLERDAPIMGLLQRDPERGKRIQTICDRTLKHTLDTLEEEPEGIIADHRYGYIAGITRQTLRRKIELRLNLSDKIDKVITSRFVGPLIMLALLYSIYLFTFWGSEQPVAWLAGFFGHVKSLVRWALPDGPLQSLLVSGIIDGVGGVLGFVPIILFMFFAIAILEDSGYMARVAYMLDRVLRWFGLHGNSVMALIVSGGISGGCAVPGVLAARTLRDPRERIATLLVAPFMNCGAKLPVYAVLIAAFFGRHEARMMFLLTLISWGFALFAAKLIRATVLRGPKTPFVMELPPYRLPTLRGLLIHTWERTWHYIQKAGTVILGFSIILWALMTYPGLSEDQRRGFDQRRETLQQAFLAEPPILAWLPTPGDLQAFGDHLERLARSTADKDPPVLPELQTLPYHPLLEAVSLLQGARDLQDPRPNLPLDAALRYLQFKKDLKDLRAEEQSAALKRTVAGWLGHKLEPLSRPLGFDYRVNVALVGGFAAKEVIVSTLGTAYSLGEVEAETQVSISERLKRDPDWGPLKAFTLIVFTMLYVPCFVTVVSIRRETSWRWAGFSIVFNLLAAYAAALLIALVGRTLGLGG